VTRFQKVAAATVALTFVLVIIGVVVRATESGLGCPDWPLCYGQLLPALGDDKAWIEWTHRGVAAILGFFVLGIAVLALKEHRRHPSILWPSLGALALVGFQAWLGRETVRLGNSGESVTAHLAAAMALIGLLVYVLARAFYPTRIGGRGASQRFTLLAAFAAISTYALLLFGSHVTATDAALVFPDWPLMGGTLFPPLTEVTSAHVLHRWAAIIVGLIVVVLAIVAWRGARDRRNRAVLWLTTIAAVLYPIQALVGALQIWTRLDPIAQTLHLALGAFIWGALAGLVVVSYYTARTTVVAGSGSGAGSGVGAAGSDLDREGTVAPRTTRDSVRAYIALTKPRIIELLLVTTVPAMVLAARGLPPVWLVFWTLVGGSLAAGSANAINCYLDRDIDELMARTRRRPLPAHEVEPERAVVFGLVLGVLSFVVLAYFVNLLAAFLAQLAIAFYVVIYTLLMKRTTPQNIVIGGAAGALPPVIGWAAVTGDVGLPALILFALVFYWTPPHFWALSLRIAKDYAAAGVPMLPVVRGVPETTRQIALYTVLLVAISLVLFAVARMGWIYLVAAVVLGAIFLWQAYRLWRVGTSAAAQAGGAGGSVATPGAIALYRYSISYLSLLFLAVAVDAVVLIPVV
jgi:heme o synthase